MMDNPSHMTLSADNGVITTTLNGIEVNTTTVDPVSYTHLDVYKRQ